MVDPGVARLILKQLNRWYRRRAKPRGTTDHYYRGTRMSYSATWRAVACLFALLLLLFAAALFFIPATRPGHSPLMVLGWKIGSLGIVVVGLIPLLQAFREFAVVNHDGVIKCDWFGRETRLAWQQIAAFQVKSEENKVIFRTANHQLKLTLSLAYDGWQDFFELAQSRLDPALHYQLVYTLAHLDAKRPRLRPATKARRPKGLSFGR